MKIFFALGLIIALSTACKSTSSGLKSETAVSSKAEYQAVLKQISGVADIDLDTLERLFTMIDEKIFSASKILDLNRYGGFAYAKQGFFTIGNEWRVPTALMQIGDFQVGDEYKLVLTRPNRNARFNLEIGKRIVFMIPKSQWNQLGQHNYRGKVMLFSDKVAVGSLTSDQQEAEIPGLFIWVYQFTDIRELLRRSLTEEIEVRFES